MFANSCLSSSMPPQDLTHPHSYVNRVSNEDVLRQAEWAKPSYILQQRQLPLLGRILQLPGEDVMRKCTFQETIHAKLSVSRQGPACRSWTTLRNNSYSMQAMASSQHVSDQQMTKKLAICPRYRRYSHQSSEQGLQGCCQTSYVKLCLGYERRTNKQDTERGNAALT